METRLALSYIQQSPSSFVPRKLVSRAHRQEQINAGPPPHAPSFQKENPESSASFNTGANSQLCCWLLSLLPILRDGVSPCSPQSTTKEKKMQFDLLPVWMPCLHDDATPHIEGSCQGLARSSPEHAAPILDPPCWERDIPPWLGLLARLSPSKHQANIATTSFSLLSNQQWVDTHPG